MRRKFVAALITSAAIACCSPANAVTVNYTMTFTPTAGAPTGGTGLLVINETLPLNTFTENFAGDIVSFVATVDGLTFNFVPANFTADIGMNQQFFSLTGSSSPAVLGPGGLMETLVLGGGPGPFSTYNITNPGGPNLQDGHFFISAGVIATPLPAALPLFAGGLGVMGLLVSRRKRKSAATAAA
jgi:hypothetical protein